MREINFRAWDLDHGRMFKVNRLQGFDDDIIVYEGARNPEKGTAGWNIILMQYTGHDDSEGTEIYEGDIFAVPLGDLANSKSKKLIVGVVYWDAEKCGLWLNLSKPKSQQELLPESADLWKPGSAWTGFYANRAGAGKVIGNIYQNPELLND